ncbi:MAG: DNA polymerase III subunit delta, partial [Acidimicrobiia bacterium]
MTDKLIPAYLIVGDDPYLTGEAIGRLLKGIPELSISHFGPGDDISEVFEALNTPPMFGDLRVVVIRDADDLSAQTLRQIESYLESPAGDASVVLTSKKPLAKIAAAVKKVGRVLEASRGKRSDLFSWLREEVKARGMKPAGDAPAALVDAVGEERLALSQALDELKLLLGDGARLSSTEVRNQFKERSDARVFGFVDAVAGRESAQA